MKMRDRSELLGNTHPLASGIRIALAAMCVSAFIAPQALAQDEEEMVLEEVVVTGTRQLVQDSISIKRDNVLVVDGLSAADIGDLPALSIGEALESLTGVASHRENGGATEVSIRGLGPYLSSTTFNGRVTTNGSGDRSVNFSQFPSELMNKIGVYKTQSANMIEGGVAGVIALETLKPLDYGKRRFQFDAKANYNPHQQNVTDNQMSNKWGYRGTLSYVDQYEFESGGSIGWSLGYQKSDISQPEQEIRGSSPQGTSIYACINEPDVTNEGFFRSSSGDCEDQVGGSSNQGYNTTINPETGRAFSDGLDWGFVSSQRGYRTNDTSDERDAFFAAFQWQPNDDWDINLDLEFSDRTQAELRHDFVIANSKRTTAGVTGPSVVVQPLGGVTNRLSTSAIESSSEKYSRREKYSGGGLDIVYHANDRLTFMGDFAYSKTTRVEKQISVRMQSDNQDIYGDNTPGGYRPAVLANNDAGFPQYTLWDFNVADPKLYSDQYRTRIDSDVDRKNEIKSGRLDFSYDVEWGGINNIEGGVRYAELTYLNLAGTRFDPGSISRGSEAGREAILAINQACYEGFPERNFLSTQVDGPLITNINSDTGEVTNGTGNSWATFDTQCVTDGILAYQGEEFAYPEQYREDAGTTDVTETTWAGYMMANWDTEWGGHMVNGNFGLRVVNTDVKSHGWRTAYTIIEDDDGFLTIEPIPDSLSKETAKYDYTEWLPSVNAVMDLTDEVLLRGAVYRSMSRADPSDLGYNRTLNVNSGDDITDPDDLINSVNGSGNPYTKPLMSWNADTSIEWYPNDDSILSFGLYYKKFAGGFQQERTYETFVVDGVDIVSPVTVTQVSSDKSTLWGIEITAAHTFSYLPGYLSGLGVKIGYNYGNSNFEFEDSLYGDVIIKDLDGTERQLTEGIVAPGNIPGFSDNVFSGVLFWGWGNFDASIIYKYRSEYFQPYTGNGTRLRFIDDVGVWEARLAYQITDNLTISAEGINLFNEPKQSYYFSKDNFGERNVYGSRYFFGLRGKF